jgi:prevent-host-death family protein
MEVTTKELRIQPGRIIEQVTHGQEIIITYRGKALARIVPIRDVSSTTKDQPEDLFGMWKNRNDIENVDTYVRTLRKGRQF